MSDCLRILDTRNNFAYAVTFCLVFPPLIKASERRMTSNEIQRGSSSSLRLGVEFKPDSIVAFNYRIIKRLGSGS